MALMKNLFRNSNALYCKICTDLWNYMWVFLTILVVPTCWLSPFGRLLFHSQWNSGQHSQLTHKVLLCFLHARTKQQPLNTTQLNSRLCYYMWHNKTGTSLQKHRKQTGKHSGKCSYKTVMNLSTDFNQGSKESFTICLMFFH